MKISNRKIIVLLVFILVIACTAYGILWLNRPTSNVQVLVTVNGVEYGSYPLHTDRTVVIGPEDGSWHNTLVIENGTAKVTEADCDNQICVHTPALTEDTIGIIVCLPHGVAVELKE